MKARLIEIPDVQVEWETEHRIRALEVNDRSPALTALRDWKRDSPADYKKIMATIKLVAGNDRVRTSRVKRCWRAKELFEMRGDKARLFFFYTKDGDETVVVVGSYWKTKASAREQNTAIDRAEKLRQVFYRYFENKWTHEEPFQHER